MGADLPKGWFKACLGDIALINPRHSSDIVSETIVTFVPMAGISSDSHKFRFTESRPLQSVRKNYTHFSEGDVLLAKITPCMENGKAAIAKGLKNGLGCGTTELHVIRPEKVICSEFLYYCLHQESFRTEAQRNMTGTAGQLRVPTKFVKSVQIPIPPENEQHRIVAKLEKLLAKVDKCKERLEKIPGILKRFRQSVLAAACSGELTKDWRKGHPEIGTSEDLLKSIQQEKEKTQNKYRIVKKKALEKTSATITRASVPQDEPEIPQSWLHIPSFDLFSFVTSGSRGWAKYYSQEGAKFIRIGNLAHDTIDLNLGSVQHVIPPDGSEEIRTRIQKHDILVSITADTGMIGLIQEDIGEAYINQHIALSRPVKGIYPKYLAWFLASKEGQRQFKALQRGATKVGLGLDDIKSIWVPLPSIAEQKEIVNRIEALFRIADEVETRYQKAKNHVNQLTQSILAKAFRGELVPQDPKDEPASVLLKRIKAERDVAKNVPKGHRKTRRLG